MKDFVLSVVIYFVAAWLLVAVGDVTLNTQAILWGVVLGILGSIQRFRGQYD